MGIVVETGVGVSNANAYIAAADADTYFSDRNNANWTGLQAVKEAAIIRATAYLDGHYRKSWKGLRVTVTQALDWPRYQVQDEAGFYPANMNSCVPPDLKSACAELALRELTASLNPDLDRGGLVQHVKAGPVEQTFLPGAPGRTTYPFIDELLSRLVVGSIGARIVRV